MLYKQPFVPKKSHNMPTVPIGFHLSSEQRAIDRAEFDKELKEKEEVRMTRLKEVSECLS